MKIDLNNDHKIDIILKTVVAMRAEVLTLKDFWLADYANRLGFKTDEERNKLTEGFDAMIKEYHHDILSQIKAREDKGLGSIDDLLNDIIF